MGHRHGGVERLGHGKRTAILPAARTFGGCRGQERGESADVVVAGVESKPRVRNRRRSEPIGQQAALAEPVGADTRMRRMPARRSSAVFSRVEQQRLEGGAGSQVSSGEATRANPRRMALPCS